MITIKVRPYGSSEATCVNFEGELENELSQQFLAAIRGGYIWPGYAEDYHLTTMEDGDWVEV